MCFDVPATHLKLRSFDSELRANDSRIDISVSAANGVSGRVGDLP